jgi:hypothetical protein
VLDQRGIGDRFVAEGQTHPAVGYSLISMDISDFPTRHNYVLALWQSQPSLAVGGGTAAGDPLAGVTADADDLEDAVSGDKGPEHPGTRR